MMRGLRVRDAGAARTACDRRRAPRRERMLRRGQAVSSDHPCDVAADHTPPAARPARRREHDPTDRVVRDGRRQMTIPSACGRDRGPSGCARSPGSRRSTSPSRGTGRTRARPTGGGHERGREATSPARTRPRTEGRSRRSTPEHAPRALARGCPAAPPTRRRTSMRRPSTRRRPGGHAGSAPPGRGRRRLGADPPEQRRPEHDADTSSPTCSGMPIRAASSPPSRAARNRTATSTRNRNSWSSVMRPSRSWPGPSRREDPRCAPPRPAIGPMSRPDTGPPATRGRAARDHRGSWPP